MQLYIKRHVYYLQNDIVMHMTFQYENNDIHMYVLYIFKNLSDKIPWSH